MTDINNEKYNLDKRIVDRLELLKYQKFTLSQELTIPYIISGFNVIMNAQTGSGKTFGFMIPILHQ